MSDRYEMLDNAIVEKTDPVFMAGRSEIIEYYQEKHGDAWKSKLASAIAGTSDKSSRAYKSASRQFQMDKRTGQERYKGKELSATKVKYTEVGKTLPPVGRKLKGDSITITVKGDQKLGGKRTGTRERTVSVTFTSTKAEQFIISPSFGDIWEEYGVDADLFEDGDYALTVNGVS